MNSELVIFIFLMVLTHGQRQEEALFNDNQKCKIQVILTELKFKEEIKDLFCFCWQSTVGTLIYDLSIFTASAQSQNIFHLE